MAKSKQAYFCKECGYESGRWLGQCPACKEWNVFVAAPADKKTGSRGGTGGNRRSAAEPKALAEVAMEDEVRIRTGIGEFDRVLGGGVVKGSLVLVGGDPGIGKSTLLLQVCREMVAKGRKVLYVSGEESLRQIKMRAERLGSFADGLYLLSETCIDDAKTVMEREKPDAVVIDSIQTMYLEGLESAAGSVGQVRETTASLMRMAKETGTSIFIVGHVTKEGVVAGPRMLEHMVDVVLYFEGEGVASYRVLRGVKNRFGSTNEVGIFEMKNIGLAEVANPSEYLLQGRPEEEAGSVVSCSMEGTRPILLEVQALVCQTNFNMPRRTAAGTDYNRVNLLMAVVEKRLGVGLSGYDAYINVAGGLRVNEPSLDLALILAILSSFRNRAVEGKTMVFGEVGLVGEVRAVHMAEQRVMEAVKMGFDTCILPQVNREAMNVKGIELRGIRNINEL